MSEQSLYQRMKSRGVQLDWYERQKSKKARNDTVIPLHDDQCYSLSVYLWKADGSLWTIKSEFKYSQRVTVPHSKVRDKANPLNKDVYICMHCRATANSPDEIAHKK